MLSLGLTSDTPTGWCKVWEIEEELRNFEKEIFPKYKDKFPFILWICFRCLPESYERKSMRRFYEQDNALGLDMSITEEQMRPFKNGKYFPLTKVEQRFLMGETLYDYLVETFKNYRNKLVGIEEHGSEFLQDTNKWLSENYWLRKDKLSFDLTIIPSLSFEKANEIFGNTIEKKVYPTENGDKIQELVWLVELERRLRTKYVLRNGTWIFLEYKEE